MKEREICFVLQESRGAVTKLFVWIVGLKGKLTIKWPLNVKLKFSQGMNEPTKGQKFLL